MRWKRYSLAAGSIMIMFVASSCGVPSRYSVTLKNETTVELTEASVTWDDYIFTAGILPPNIEKTELVADARFPRKATVKWRTDDGEFHVAEINVESNIGQHSRWANLRVVFSVFENEVVKVSKEKGFA